jgi:transcriptional regulator with XRE-family HTH domain
MRDINIGAVILKKRKEKNITQDELAEFIGVSKAAVSKWETDQSYPDIVLLPGLASYFNVTIDELIGYLPQMTERDIKITYRRLIENFSNKPFDTVIKECRAISEKYYSCFKLIFRIALLYINHHMLAPDKESAEALLKEAINLLNRIKSESGDVRLSREANSMEAVCHMILGDPDKVLELLDSGLEPDIEVEGILSSAYTMKGDIKRAKEILQISAYKHLVSLAALMPPYLSILGGEGEKFDYAADKVDKLINAFELNKLHPNSAMQIYYVMAQTYAVRGDKKACIDMLLRYTAALENLIPLVLKGDRFFDMIDGWLKELEFGENAPREGKVIMDSITGSLMNPQFDLVREDINFINILEKVKELKVKL